MYPRLNREIQMIAAMRMQSDDFDNASCMSIATVNVCMLACDSNSNSYPPGLASIVIDSDSSKMLTSPTLL